MWDIFTPGVKDGQKRVRFCSEYSLEDLNDQQLSFFFFVARDLWCIHQALVSLSYCMDED